MGTATTQLATELRRHGVAWAPVRATTASERVDVQVARDRLHAAARQLGVKVRTTKVGQHSVRGTVVGRAPRRRRVPQGDYGQVVHRRSGVVHALAPDGLGTRCGKLTASRPVWRPHSGTVDCACCLGAA